MLVVTGAAGLLGSYLIQLLEAHNEATRIIALVRQKDAAKQWGDSSRITVVEGDLRDATTWEQLPATVTHIFHTAATIERTPGLRWQARQVSDNLIPLGHLLEHSRRWAMPRQIIYSSSVSVYGQTHERLTEQSATKPDDPYAAGKLAGEDLLSAARAQGVTVTCLRYSSLYGVGMYPGTVLPRMVHQALEDDQITVHGRGRRRQDFLHASDAATANLLAYLRNADGIFNIGSGVSISMVQLASHIARVFTNNSTRVVFADEQSEGGGGFELEISKAERELGYRPRYQIEAGLLNLRTTPGATPPCARFQYS